MWGLEELKQQRKIVDRIDWDMTPEKAVETYLGWDVYHHGQDQS